MRSRLSRSAFLVFALVVGSCTDSGRPIGPPPQFAVTGALPAVRISEIHYDNTGTDAGEAIEISGPAGSDLTGWQLVLYNGSGGASYTTTNLSGTIPATCGPRGVIVVNYPVNGIQNGSPDGVALVAPLGVLIEFLSYEGPFAATNGPALGVTAVDIGVSETGSEPLGLSLQRSGSDVWRAPSTHTFGTCNDDVEPPPPATVTTVTVSPVAATIVAGATQAFSAAAFDAAQQPVPAVVFTWSSTAPAIADVNANGLATGLAPGDAGIVATAPNGVADTAELHVNAAPPPGLPDTRFSELHYDNFGTDAGEAIEVEGPAGTDLTGWSVVLYNGNGGVVYSTRALSGTIANMCSGRGVVFLTYPQDGIQNGSPDGMALVDAGGQVVEFLSYEGILTATAGPAAGLLSTDIIATEVSVPLGQSLQRDGLGVWQLTAANFGACFGDPPPPPANTIAFTGRTAGDPALPVGFQDQLFATLRDGSGAPVAATFTWTSETAALASIDDDGVVTALGEGTAIIRATADEGTTATFTLVTRVAAASSTALYAGNAEFGEPTDADPGDDFVVRRDQYTASYSHPRGTPNWVSYEIDPTHFGPEDRCDCFTFDPALPAAFPRYTTADYTGAGAFHGYGIDRGHLARSFDRTSASLDNATTFYFTNIIPQAADLNQGPWSELEFQLGNRVRFDNREVYVVAGVAGNKGTVKDEGRIVIPARVWKVALVLPHDQGLGNVQSIEDVELIAVDMPNDPGVRNVPWETYRTTVDAIEALSGYDLLALLPDQIEIALESGTRPPVAATDGPYASSEGGAVSMSGALSSDPDGDPLSYAWLFGDGASGTGVTVSHTYAQDGAYVVQLTVTDSRGLVHTAATSALVVNVTPSIGAFDGATLFPGEAYTTAGSFTDPGADLWSATVDYGDGSGVAGLVLAGKSFSLAHTYVTAGSFTVTVRVADDDATGMATQVVTVLTPAQGVAQAIALVDQFAAAGRIATGNANMLGSLLGSAADNLADGDAHAAANQLENVLRKLDALEAAGRITAADAAALRTLVARVLQAVEPA